ncbi:MAG: XF1762 family protein [Panacagrimonas sp.]
MNEKTLEALQVGRSAALDLTPINFDEANAFVAAHHRHHKPVPGAKFSVAVSEGETVRGVAIVGRPVARMADDGWTLEVNRCCTDGSKNACSMLYGAAWRVARAMGYRRLITYTLPEEGGASLRAAGWKLLGEAGGGSWSRTSRPRVDTAPMQRKLCWSAPRSNNRGDGSG